jgi:NAD(P)-dependent dehydrogenase (short-subunit alcohol dehydrogenase family)
MQGKDDTGLAYGSSAEMQQLAEELIQKYGIQAMPVVLDVTSNSSIDAAYGQVMDRFGGLDILVNNAGAAFGAPSPIKDYDEKAWEKTFDVNVTGILRLSKKFIPSLIQRQGRIVNMASTAGKGPNSFIGAYSCAKTSVIMMTKVMAKELGPSNVRVNAICPGIIMTDLQKLRIELEAKNRGITPEERKEQLQGSIPLQRIADPSEVASLAAFLVSREASYISGQAINVCGGRTLEL